MKLVNPLGPVVNAAMKSNTATMSGTTALCTSLQARLSEYLDGAVSGIEMRQIADHLTHCNACADEFALAARLQQTMVSLGTVKAPTNLGLKLRVAISQERARSWHTAFERFGLRFFADTVVGESHRTSQQLTEAGRHWLE